MSLSVATDTQAPVSVRGGPIFCYPVHWARHSAFRRWVEMAFKRPALFLKTTSDTTDHDGFRFEAAAMMSEGIPFKQQATIYALLSRIFIGELDRQSVAALSEPELLAVFEKLHDGFRDYLEGTSWDDQELERLASDYCHLFILPQKSSLSLQASHWVSDEAYGRIAQIGAVIDRLDVDVPAWSQPFENVPNDHLGVLLALMSAVYGSDSPDIQKLGPQLADQVFGSWIGRFDHKLSTATSNPIYIASSRLLLELLEYK